MKSKMKFTLVELLAVIAIIGILATALVAGISSAMTTAKAAACSANLSDLGKAMVQYKLDNGFFPCGVKDTDSNTTIERMQKQTRRSTLRTISMFREYDGQDIELTRYFCPESGKQPPRRHTDKLSKSNVGYHYVDGNVTERVLKANLGLMRDLNEGHDNASYGNVLLGGGNVKKISKKGSESNSRPGNYKMNWYANKDVFINYKSFASYSRKVNFEKPDDID